MADAAEHDDQQAVAAIETEESNNIAAGMQQFAWLEEKLDTPEKRTHMATNFARSIKAHYFDEGTSFPLFKNIVGIRTQAFLLPFPGATLEQKTFRKYMKRSWSTHRHFLTNFVVHRLFYHPDLSQRIGYATSASAVITAVDQCMNQNLRFRTTAYQRSISTEVMKAAVLELFEVMPYFWLQNSKHAYTDSFPVKELMNFLKPQTQMGALNVGLVVQDLATAGVITKQALLAAVRDGVVDGKDTITLVGGKGGIAGLRLLMGDEAMDSNTPNELLQLLYNALSEELFDENTTKEWDNLTTVEHFCCKFYRVVSYCTGRPERRAEFWKVVGMAEAAEK